MQIIDVFGYPVGIIEPFTPSDVLDIQRDVDAFIRDKKRGEGVTILETTHWNANCLTSAPDGYGKKDDEDVGEEHPYTRDDSIIVRAVKQCLTQYLETIGLGHLRPAMYKCGKEDCDECFKDCWINVYREGHFQETHWHHENNDGCVFGFVYFIKYDHARDGKFTFVNPAPDLNVEGLDACPAFRREFVPDVTQGTLMFFPSFMLHRVTTQPSDSERITMAGNFFVGV